MGVDMPPRLALRKSPPGFGEAGQEGEQPPGCRNDPGGKGGLLKEGRGVDGRQLWGAAGPQPLRLSIAEGRQGAGGLIFPLLKIPLWASLQELVSALPTREQHCAAGARKNRKEDLCRCLNEPFPPE